MGGAYKLHVGFLHICVNLYSWKIPQPKTRSIGGDDLSVQVGTTAGLKPHNRQHIMH